ncbi:MAG: hypothetical protein H6737_01370 [Alphaproteobacteria bacterium]|nr:hypothetical protein [Alphaproteobacteria bacterium]
MRTAFALTAASFALALATACGPESEKPDSAAFVDALPDERILINMPMGGDRAVGAMAESYVTTAQVTSDVNGFISDVLDAVDHVTDFEPTWTEADNKFLWGPWSEGGLDPNETALYVEFDEAANKYGWAIIQRPKGSTSDEDWVAVIGGESFPGATEDEGEGMFAVDFDAIAALNPTETVAGKFYSSYIVTADGVAAEAGFEDFTDDTSAPERITAGYRYGQDAAGAGYMDLGYLADIHQDGSLEETIVLRTRWQADGQGRGDMVVFDGDLAPLAYQGSECWGSDFNVVYEENNAELVMNGDESQCAFGDPEWNDDAPEA